MGLTSFNRQRRALAAASEGAVVGRPAKGDNKRVWAEFAATLDIVVEGMTKPEIVAAVEDAENEEIESDGEETEDEETDGEETEDEETEDDTETDDADAS